ncbi:11092_t:CDS:1, partial [Funneliformis geosporum]
AIEFDEVYRFNKYDGGFNKGSKLTLSLAQHTAKDGNVRLLLSSFSFIQNLALQWVQI